MFSSTSPAPIITIIGKIIIITIDSYIPFIKCFPPSILGKAKHIDKIIEHIINVKGIWIFNFNLDIRYPAKKGYNNLAKPIYISQGDISQPPMTVYSLNPLFFKTLKISKFNVKFIVKNELIKVRIHIIILFNLRIIIEYKIFIKYS